MTVRVFPFDIPESSSKIEDGEDTAALAACGKTLAAFATR